MSSPPATSKPGLADRLLPPRLTRHAVAIGVAFLVLGAISITSALFLFFAERIGSICVDGWESSSTGAGRCSGHGGVSDDLEANTFLGLAPDNRFSLSRQALAVFGLGDVGVGAALVRIGRRNREQTIRSVTNGRSESARRSSPATLGVLELNVRTREIDNRRSVSVSIEGGPVVTETFDFNDQADRGASELRSLMTAHRKKRLGRSERSVVEDYGSALFDALFPGEARAVYRDGLAQSLTSGSRLRLLLDLDERSGDLPWEYLFDADRSSFLAMSQDTSVMRFIDHGPVTRNTAPIDQLRVLVMASSPSDLDPLDVDNECRQVEARLAQAGTGVSTEFVEGQTLDHLRSALTRFEPHVFHFVGHGLWDVDVDDGAVAFADAQGRSQSISGRDLGVVLNRPGMRLVLFNSCQAARTSRADPFAGVARSLVAQGVPAAIGMQYPIEDRSAAAFGTEFVASLVESQSIDHALTEARTAVYASRSPIEWATPVLMTRVHVEDIIRWAP